MAHTRLPVICLGSLIGNAVLWSVLAAGTDRVIAKPPPPELVFERVTIPKQEISKPKQVPKVAPIKPKLPKPVPVPAPVQRPTEAPPKPAAHNRVIVAKDTSPAKSKPDFQALGGGNAKLGAPTSGQNPGSAVTNPSVVAPPTTTKPVTAPPTQPAPPVKHEEPVAPPPPPPPPPKQEPPPPPPPPQGPTKEAVPTHQENPEIPENLKSQTFKAFVRVKVAIAADGSFTVTLRTSSGNPDIDKLVLDALNRWKWKPALKNGEAVDSIQAFRFNFSVD